MKHNVWWNLISIINPIAAKLGMYICFQNGWTVSRSINWEDKENNFSFAKLLADLYWYIDFLKQFSKFQTEL